jgi:MraZ protein
LWGFVLILAKHSQKGQFPHFFLGGVPLIMFRGSQFVTLDAKFRMAVPARYRDAVPAAQSNNWVLTAHPDGFLMMYLPERWEIVRAQIAALPNDADWFKRILLTNEEQVTVDSGGRVLVSASLRDEANLGRELRMGGVETYVEIWDAAIYKQKRELAQILPRPASVNTVKF